MEPYEDDSIQLQALGNRTCSRKENEVTYIELPQLLVSLSNLEGRRGSGAILSCETPCKRPPIEIQGIPG